MRAVNLGISILAGILVLSAIVALAGNSTVDSAAEVKSDSAARTITSHAPIYIDGNAGFTKPDPVNGGGNGTESDPYVIENWDISAETGHGIWIENTNVYFVIRNCYIHDAGANLCGIGFSGVTNGVIENVKISNNFMSTRGISIECSSQNHIKNCVSTNSTYGIWLHISPNNIIENCSFYYNTYGFLIHASENNILRWNDISENEYNFGIMPDGSIYYHVEDIDTTNTVNGKPLYYFVGQNNLVIDETMEIGYLAFISCINVTVKNIQITKQYAGVTFVDVTYSLIENCTFYDNSYGICFWYASHNQIIDCMIHNNQGHGIFIGSASDNDVINCICYSNYDGIHLESSSNNNITNCNVYNNYCGIYLCYSSNNKIHYNNIYNNTDYGIYNWNSETQYQVNATYNRWGSASGPSGVGFGSGDAVTSNVLYEPWLIEPYHPPLITITQPKEGLITNQNVTLVYSIDVPFTSAGAPIPVIIDGPTNGTIYTAEGVYNVTINVIDEAGNTDTAFVFFTIDKTPPTITIEDVINGTFYNVSVIPVIGITDLNLNTSQITLNDTIFVSGTPVTEEGNYVLFVQATDKANNTATKIVSFTIDKTDPVIEITGVANNTYYNVSVTPIVGIIDINLNISIITLNGQSFTSGTTVTADGSYILVVQAIDKAGNTASKTVSFTVDKTLPEIVVTGIADNAYYNISVTPVVDITDLNLNTTSVMLNSEIFISGTTVVNEGNYVLYAQATDKANNVVTKTLSFTIDKTKPTINITGVTNGSYYNTDVIPIIDVSDANINITSITLNGNPFASGNTISTENEYILVVQATDNAGNNATKTITFTIDKTPPTISNLVPVAGIKTTDDTILISGKTEPDSVVKINGIDVSVSSDGSFSKGITLAKGENTITITSTDLVGNTQTETITITKTEKEGGGKGFIPGFEAATLLIAVISICIILLRRRKDF